MSYWLKYSRRMRRIYALLLLLVTVTTIAPSWSDFRYYFGGTVNNDHFFTAPDAASIELSVPSADCGALLRGDEQELKRAAAAA